MTSARRRLQRANIEPDLLLIYRNTKCEIYFDRTGTHSDLF
ncbi:MAG: type II toxin-antitoxin system YafQ family toxin [Chlamydiae bacterium]|nr:type II toxin-antitoxin system YafQ family toxin [Chlamydiota bacterium]MBI5465144.1 type II toxin-antitoxin system YafQ family toxin [Candidatus Gottesmanbacteria bacterium]